MSGTVLLKVQNAVRDALVGDAALMALATGVFDHVPPGGQPFPYVLLGEKTEKEYPAMGREGLSATLVVDVRSQATGDTELLAMYERVKTVLDTQPLVLAGYEVAARRTTLVKTAVEEDGVTRRAETRLEVIAQVEVPAPPPPDPEPPAPEEPPVDPPPAEEPPAEEPLQVEPPPEPPVAGEPPVG